MARDQYARMEAARERLSRQIAAEVKTARLRAGLTQAQLAERIGTAQPTIARIESGRHYCITIRTLGRIAVACGCAVKVSMKG